MHPLSCLRSRHLPAPFAALSLLVTAPAMAQLASGPAQILAPGHAGLPGPAQEGARFGSSLVFADFDCDGFDDLAIGSYGLDYASAAGPVIEAGAVYLVYGSPQGLSSRTALVFEEDLENAAALAEEGDRFGLTLAAGNFDGDSSGGRPCEDLVVGSPYEDIGTTIDAGAVWIVHGASGGLDLSRVQVWSQSSNGVRAASETNDQFGRSLAAGDFDGGGFDDLAIGAPFEVLDDGNDEGAITILRGSAVGLTAPNITDSSWRQLVHQDLAEVLDQATPGDLFGQALAACDLDDDGRDDLVVGVPGEDIVETDGGAIHTFFGAADGLDLVGQALEEEPLLVPFARLGSSFAVGEFLESAPGCEIVTGAPSYELSGDSFAGVVLLYKPERGESGSFLFGFSASAFPGETAEAGDLFGSGLVGADFDGDGLDDDLVIGAPGRGGVDRVGRLFWSDSEAGAAGPGDFLPQGYPVKEAGLGHPLAAGDIDGDGIAELAAGLFDYPAEAGHPLGLPVRSGMVLLIRSAVLFRDGFESGGVAAWSSTTP